MATSSAKLSEREKKQESIALTSYLMHKHYCDNDIPAVVSLFGEHIHWIGAAEQEYQNGKKEVTDIFRSFTGKLQKCNITGEEYEATEIAPDVVLCTGRMWISTDPTTETYLRVHQRISTVFLWTDGIPRCVHIHASNPYTEMQDDETGFPIRMARHSYEYMQQCIAQQKKQIAAQANALSSIYNTLPCAIMRFKRNQDGSYRLITFNRATCDMMQCTKEEIENTDWSNGFCGQIEWNGNLRARLDSLKKPGDSVTLEYKLHRKTGEPIDINSTNSLVSEEDGGPVIQRISFDITERVKMETLLKRKSYEDAMTGLFNRNKFNQILQSGPDGKSLGFAYFDINGLKAINDSKGHHAGDDLLRRAAGHISRIFAQNAYRIGGDEFAALEEGAGETEFQEKVQAVCTALRNDSIESAVGTSWQPAGAADIKKQFEEADREMYRAKAAFYQNRNNDRRKS